MMIPRFAPRSGTCLAIRGGTERLASQTTQSRLVDILTRNTANIEALRSRLADGMEAQVSKLTSALAWRTIRDPVFVGF